jgi:hypothetical protein
MKLRSAIDAGRPYELPERHDPLYLMFDNDYLLGRPRTAAAVATQIFITMRTLFRFCDSLARISYV